MSTLLSRSLSGQSWRHRRGQELLSSPRGHDGRVAVKLLEASKATKLRAQKLTYAEVGRPVAVPPVGYAHLSRTHQVAESTDFGVAGRALMTWEVQAFSGLRILASSLEAELGTVVIMRLGVGAVALSIPCRVVDVIDEPDRQGFSYGSLPGHPESGEESFLLRRAEAVSPPLRSRRFPARLAGSPHWAGR